MGIIKLTKEVVFSFNQMFRFVKVFPCHKVFKNCLTLEMSVIFQVGDSMGNSFSYPPHVKTWSRISVLPMYVSIHKE
jgi:hypothetical protein